LKGVHDDKAAAPDYDGMLELFPQSYYGDLVPDRVEWRRHAADPLEVRKATLRSMLAKAGLGLRFNEHLEGDGRTIFAHACKMGLAGIVSKRKDSPFRSGRLPAKRRKIGGNDRTPRI
jgi:hypothetical protein